MMNENNLEEQPSTGDSPVVKGANDSARDLSVQTTSSVAEQTPTAEKVVVRRSQLSTEQRAALEQKFEQLCSKLLFAIRENGAGQALAWLDAKSNLEEVALLQIKLCSTLELSSEDHTIYPEYAKLSSPQAVNFRSKLEDALLALTS